MYNVAALPNSLQCSISTDTLIHSSNLEKPRMNMNTIITLYLLIISWLTFTDFTFAAIVRCPNCGRTPVPYPLSTDSTCGQQDYKIRCTSGSLYFDTLNDSSYPIISITPATQRIVIRPASIIPNTCTTPDSRSEGLQLNSTLPFNVTSSNTILLMNCSDYLLGTPVNCSSTSICGAYLSYAAPASPCKSITFCCDFTTGGSKNAYGIQIKPSRCMAYYSFVNLDPTLPVDKWPAPGFELEWALPREPGCKSGADCAGLKGSRCLPDPGQVGQKRCVCRVGKLYWDPITGLCKKCGRGPGCKIKKTNIPLTIGSTFAAIVFVVLSGFLIYRQLGHAQRLARKILVKEREEILNANNNNGKAAKIFSWRDLKKAVNHFSRDNLLGTGGFGEVFKGVLEDGTIVAVKRAKPGNTKGTSQVLNEVRILCQVNHRGLVRLLGCCVELEEPLLIYEYISNGTLFEHLHGVRFNKRTPLSWRQRLHIAHQTAQGLAYLHFSAVPPIYHRDVKTSNILLDDKLDAKVSDFGLSRLVEISESDCTHINTSAQGTLGYLDPEYYINLQLTDRSDVYSFGVVLLELLTSKKAIDFNREEENVNLVVYMKKVMDKEKLMEVVDPTLLEGASKVELETFKALGNLAAACLDDRRQNRPSMKEVSEEIEYIISIITGEVPNM